MMDIQNVGYMCVCVCVKCKELDGGRVLLSCL